MKFGARRDDINKRRIKLTSLSLCFSGPNRGHYIAIVKSHDFWLLFDDDIVEKIDAQAIEEFYGLTSDISKNSESGYILFYQSRD